MNATPFRVERLEPRMLLAAGMLDPSFGTQGILALGSNTDSATATIESISHDGTFYVAGTSTGPIASGSAVVRYHADQTVDTSFGTSGQSFIEDFSVAAMVQQVDGKILLAGTVAASSSGGSDLKVVRLLSSGALDTGFGVSGIVTIDAGAAERGRSILLRRDGRILVGGITSDSSSSATGKFVFARLLPTGAIDTAFGTDGIATINSGTFPVTMAQAGFTRDGRIVVAGTWYQGPSLSSASHGMLLRLRGDGSLDARFGTGGIAIDDGRTGTTFGYGALLVLPNSEVLVAGQQRGAAVILQRYTARGGMETSLAQGACGAINFGRIKRVRIAPGMTMGIDGTIRVAVTVGPFTPSKRTPFYQPGIVRFTQNGSPDPTFGDNGKTLIHWGPGVHDANAFLNLGSHWIVAGGRRGDFELSTFDAVTGRPVTSVGQGGKVTTDIQPGAQVMGAVELSGGRTVALLNYSHRERPFVLMSLDGADSFNHGRPIVLDADSNGNVVLALRPGGAGLAVISEINVGTGEQYDPRQLIQMFDDQGLPVPTFGNAGSLTLPISNDLSVVRTAIFHKGKLIIAGDDLTGAIALTRFNEGGSVDDTFGQGGTAVVRFRNLPTEEFTGIATGISALAIQDDGKIVASGTDGLRGTPEMGGITDYKPFVLRFDANGQLDPTFGDGGKVIVDVGANGGEVVIQPDGKLILNASRVTNSWNNFTAIVLVRLNPNGTVDSSFGQGGIVDYTGGVLSIWGGLTLQPDGKLLIGGGDYDNVGSSMILRFNPDGSPDSTFGTDGRVEPTSGDYQTVVSFWLQPDGSIMAVCTSDSGPFLVRILNDSPLLHAQIIDHTLVITGSPGDDRIVLAGGTEMPVYVDGLPDRFALADFSAVRIDGLGGNDYIDLPAFNHEFTGMWGPVPYPVTIDGGAGDDTIISGPGGDQLLGSDGDDSILAGAGDDTVFAHLGNDTLYGNDGNDYLSGGPGNDQIFGNAGNDQIVADDGEKDTVDGGEGFDRAATDVIDEVTEVEGVLG